MNSLLQHTPAAFLRALLLERRERNPSYSTHAFARDLGMSQSLLSRVLNEKCPLTLRQAAQISALLGFSAEETERFIETAMMALPPNAKALGRIKAIREAKSRERPRPEINLELERFTAISQWFHVAILDLISTKGFRNDPRWIACRLKITPYEARDAVQRLQALGFVECHDGRLRKADGRIYFQTQRSEAAVRSFHKQMIQKGLAQLDRTDPEDFAAREISGITMAIQKKSLPLAREKIRKFKQELAELLGDTDCDEVYQLHVLMFPLTRPDSNPKENT